VHAEDLRRAEHPDLLEDRLHDQLCGKAGIVDDTLSKLERLGGELDQVVALRGVRRDGQVLVADALELDGLVESEAAEAAWVRVHVVATTVVHGLLVRMTSTGTRKARGVRLLDGVVLVCPPYATPCLATCGPPRAFGRHTLNMKFLRREKIGQVNPHLA
jgi:hypothetical protein